MREPLFGYERPRVFIEENLKGRLASLSPRGRSAFAWSCSARLFPGYLRWHQEIGTEPHDYVRELMIGLAEKLRTSDEYATYSELNDKVDPLLDLLPSEDSPWSPSYPIADDAVASLAYTLLSMANGNPQEATRAARRAYEAADQLAVFDLSPGTSDFPPEGKLLAHPSVQAELARQEHDFGQILQGNTGAVIDTAFAHSIFEF